MFSIDWTADMLYLLFIILIYFILFIYAINSPKYTKRDEVQITIRAWRGTFVE